MPSLISMAPLPKKFISAKHELVFQTTASTSPLAPENCSNLLGDETDELTPVDNKELLKQKCIHAKFNREKQLDDSNKNHNCFYNKSNNYDSVQKPYPISRAELTVHYIVWIAHSLAAIVIAVRLSASDTGRLVEHWMTPSDYVDGIKMDDSDIEWKLFRKTSIETAVAYMIHSIVFQLTTHYLPDRVSSVILVVFWLILHLYLTSIKCILFIGAFALLITSIVVVTRRESIVWLLCSTFVLNINHWAPFTPLPTIYYREFNFYLYTFIRILNYCIHLVRNKPKDEKLRLSEVVEYAEYLFYPMYSSSLIVLYDDFREQIVRARITTQNVAWTTKLRKATCSAIRLVSWFILLNCSLHFWRVNAFFDLPHTFLQRLHEYEFIVAYLAGQLFHVKYVVIFGLPRLFAQIDGMCPPMAPICISRVSKYSKMWRSFDQGLYIFLKKQVYIPLMINAESKGDDSILIKLISLCRKLLSTVAVFLFVLGWHGVSPNHIYWILLSIVELAVERLGHFISQHAAALYIKRRIGLANWTRLTAFSMVTTVVPGIFGIFFFLGGRDAGECLFSRVLVNGTWNIVTLNIYLANSGFVMLHLYVLSYSFNHVCLHLEGIFSVHKKKQKLL